MEGSTISHYKILEQLGQGGMGEVYKAEDLKLGRQVALKFLAPHLVADPEVHKRFEREARAAAALDHPNICTVHEIDEADGKTFLAMSLVEGETLEHRIEKGPLPFSEALDIARQIADGLQAAHSAGVVHRDIKPGNVVAAAQGRVTILDFGLAMLTEGSKLTQLDTTVGTVAYMSPEQSQGGMVDHRTDIWALGCILYEMVSGKRAFEASYDQALVYSIVNEAPEPLTGLRTGVPVELELLVEKCLAKDAGQRYQSGADLIIDIDTLKEKLQSGRSRVMHSQMSGALRAEPQVAQTAGGSNRERAAWAVAAVLGAAFAVTAGIHFNEQPPERPALRRFAVTPAGEVDVSRSRASVAVSPDSRYVVYATAGLDAGLWVQDLGQSEPRFLEGTAGGRQPFWSPDSAFIGYEADGELRKISVEGGLSVRLCELPSPVFSGGAWSPDGEVIVFSSGDYDLYQVSAQGGGPELLMNSETATGEPSDLLARPYFLPLEVNRRVLLYSFGSSRDGWKIALQDLDNGDQRVIGPGTRPAYSPSGHLVYQADLDTHDIWALPFSLDTLRATGDSFPVEEGGRAPTVALDRTMVYLDSAGGSFRRLIWRNRAGEKVGEIGTTAAVMRDPELSPDGQYVAISQTDLSAGGSSIWLLGAGAESRQRLTFGDHTDLRPRWSPSGTEIAFASTRTGTYDLYRRRADGTGVAELIWGGPAVHVPFGWSRDRKYLLVTSRLESGKGSIDIAYLRRQESGDEFEAQPFLATPSTEIGPTLSPDGRFLAYCSDASGTMEVYVRPFPAGDGQWQVSDQGGCQPRWSRDGKELYYVRHDVLLAVGVRKTNSFTTTPSAELFSDPMLAFRNPNGVEYDVAADGRFLMFERVAGDEEAQALIRIVQNWDEEFRDKE